MSLEALAIQLESQGVYSGYVQGLDWETWILRSCLLGDLSYLTVKENTKKTKSLVLHLLQEYVQVAEALEAAGEAIELLELDLADAEPAWNKE